MVTHSAKDAFVVGGEPPVPQVSSRFPTCPECKAAVQGERRNRDCIGWSYFSCSQNPALIRQLKKILDESKTEETDARRRIRKSSRSFKEGEDNPSTSQAREDDNDRLTLSCRQEKEVSRTGIEEQPRRPEEESGQHHEERRPEDTLLPALPSFIRRSASSPLSLNCQKPNGFVPSSMWFRVEMAIPHRICPFVIGQGGQTISAIRVPHL